MVKVPDRWLEYSTTGKRIPGTRIICFKTPLRERFTVPESSDMWTVGDLLKRIPNLGLVVDLTFSTKYYDSDELLEKGIDYKKIACEGRVIPSACYINEFLYTVDDFLARNRHNDKLIGVHCTHGLNRTGYFVSYFMIRNLHLDPKNAVKAFEEARGYKIERHHYVKDLCSRIQQIKKLDYTDY